MLNVTSVQAATLKRSATNLTCSCGIAAQARKPYAPCRISAKTRKKRPPVKGATLGNRRAYLAVRMGDNYSTLGADYKESAKPITYSANFFPCVNSSAFT